MGASCYAVPSDQGTFCLTGLPGKPQEAFSECLRVPAHAEGLGSAPQPGAGYSAGRSAGLSGAWRGHGDPMLHGDPGLLPPAPHGLCLQSGSSQPDPFFAGQSRCVGT